MLTKTKTFHYKVARFNNDPEGYSLQELIEDACDNAANAIDRANLINENDQYFQLINFYNPAVRKKGSTMIGAELISFCKGESATFLDFTNKKDKEIPIEAFSLTEKGKEVLQGALYFGVLGNDVAITQSHSLKIPDLEKYLNWLIKNKGQLWTRKNNFINLCDPEYKLVNFDEIGSKAKEINIISPIEFKPDTENNDTTKIKAKPVGLGMNLIKSFFESIKLQENLTDEITMDQIINTRSLEIGLQLKWKGNKDLAKPYNLLEQVTKSFRHIEDEFNYEIVTDDGKRVKKNQLKRSKTIPIVWRNNRPELDDIFEKTIKYLTENDRDNTQ